MNADTIESPCVKICILDPATQRCTGCYRTLDEIARWANFSARQRAQIMQALAARRAQADRATRDIPTAPPRCRGFIVRCAQCAARFVCNPATPGDPCWCASFARVTPPVHAGDTCLCPTCLAQAADRQRE